MKIALYYTRPFEMGGVEQTMYARGKLLKEAGHEITYVINCKDPGIPTLEKWSEIGNIIPYKHLKETFDVVIYDAIYETPKINADRIIQVCNGNAIDANEPSGIEADEYIAVSEECAKQVKEKFNIKCKVIPNIIDENDIKGKMVEKCDIPKKKYTFCCVARFDEVKGQHKLVPFISDIDKELGKDYQFIFVGSNDKYPRYMEKFKKDVSQYNCIFVGRQDNPYKYMYNSNYVVIPSEFESQCMVLDEALICGTPVISTDFPVAKTKIDGKNGILVNKEFTTYDLKAILKLKKGFEYKYPSYKKEWLEAIKTPPKKDIKFSIIIPNYNNGEYLEKCLDSVINQTYKNYEIIFVDDMSTDNSVEIVEKYQAKNKICIVKLQTKRLNGGARNEGIIRATGDYIMCIDSDDWLKHDKVLEMLNRRIKKQDVIFLGFDLYDGKKEDLYPFKPNYENLYQAFINDVCAIWTKVVKTSILKDTLFPEGTLAEDRVHHYRVVEKCKTFLCISESTHVWNRANSHSVTTARSIEWEASIYKHLGEMYKFIKTTKDEKYRQYVIMKYNRQKKELLDDKKYRQL